MYRLSSRLPRNLTPRDGQRVWLRVSSHGRSDTTHRPTQRGIGRPNQHRPRDELSRDHENLRFSNDLWRPERSETALSVRVGLSVLSTKQEAWGFDVDVDVTLRQVHNNDVISLVIILPGQPLDTPEERQLRTHQAEA